LYHAIFKSRKPEAIKFRQWVTTEVLPSIRKNKAYIKPDATAENIAAAMTPSQQLEFFEKSLALLSKCGVLEDWHKRLVGDAVSNLW
ncbi:BRO-N domain-containing protein, partial [Chroococcidiopsis sp.]|uniref:BRO-N domain-containing protein n=1 Tax=Chroococcidiopsis sp. TaxID=3088168 RepID=UPI003F2E4FB1